MFDVGFSELVLIAVVAMIVIGPERLPKVARTAGALLGRMQRYVANVKSEVEREMQFEDLKKLQQEIQAQSKQVENSILSPNLATQAQTEFQSEDPRPATKPASKPKSVRKPKSK